MIGFEVFVKDQMRNAEKIKETLFSIFSQADRSMSCYTYDYELVDCRKGKEIEIEGPLPPLEIGNLLRGEDMLLTCGRFFCYPKNTVGSAIDSLADFWDSSCETVILVCDWAFIEVYSKNQAFWEKCFHSLYSPDGEIDLSSVDLEGCARTSLLI